ncbi:methyl-accepting chemotaxis protein [Malaciobacter sp. WC5094]
MKNLSIKNKILTIVTISIVSTFLISLIIINLESKNLAQNQKNDFTKIIYDTAKEELNAYSQLAESSIKYYLDKSTQNSIINEIEDDKNKAINVIKELNIERNNYTSTEIISILEKYISNEKDIYFQNGKNIINSLSNNNKSYISSFYIEALNITINIKANISDVENKYKKQAAKVLSNLRFLGNGYFYGVELKNDNTAWYVVDGSKFKRFGKQWDLTHKDKKGRAYRKQIINTLAKSKNGITYVPYVFYNPKTKQLNEKLAIGKLFKQWNWIIISGIYLTDMNKKIDQSYNSNVKSIDGMIEYLTLAISITSILILLIISYFVARYIKREFNSFENGLISFFSFLNKETKEVTLLTNDSKDELGKMAKVVNENIINAKNNLEKNSHFIEIVQDTVKDVKQGYLNKKITEKVDDENLEELRLNLNEMLNSLANNVGKDINLILEALDRLSKNDFTQLIDDNTGKISIAINNVINLINSMLQDNEKNGLSLKDSSTQLSKYVQELNHSSTQAASSLEETSAAVEEITSNIRSNTNNIIQMSSYTNDLKDSSSSGEKLALETTTSMEEINNQVIAINDAISVIDQIAFQTNILSLNAAVEAATAGEAGKGFAVVAQEVRNLASRSAEAAKEIKDLVENATQKTSEGKTISNTMIEGYRDLNTSIGKTIDLIKDIETSSKEQLLGIEQINNAINSLDKQTQENASMAMQSNLVANNTSSIAAKILEDVNEKKFKH